MTEQQVDLDAIELRAMRFHKLNPLHECFDSTTVLALVAELRQERERADEAEREAEEITTAWLDKDRQIAKAETALSRAEETIEAVEDLVTRHYLDTHMGERVLAILTEYDKQKGADLG